MRKFLSGLALALSLLAVPAAAFDSDAFTGRGVVRAVRWIEGDVMLQTEDGFHLFAVEDDAAIRDAFGARVTLRDLVLGSEVEYTARYWQGLAFASSLRVRPRAFVLGAK